eukprot:SAG31_NODE_40129_length_283_cov_0.619565_1_plen_50_part_01
MRREFSVDMLAGQMNPIVGAVGSTKAAEEFTVPLGKMFFRPHEQLLRPEV